LGGRSKRSIAGASGRSDPSSGECYRHAVQLYCCARRESGDYNYPNSVQCRGRSSQARSCCKLVAAGGNVTGINFFSAELTAKRLEILRDLLPKAARIGGCTYIQALDFCEPSLITSWLRQRRRRLRQHGQLSITTFWVEASAAKCVPRRQARTPRSRGNPPQADVIWSPREGWAVPARFRTVQDGRKDLSFGAQPLRSGRGRLHVRTETSRVHHAARRRPG